MTDGNNIEPNVPYVRSGRIVALAYLLLIFGTLIFCFLHVELSDTISGKQRMVDDRYRKLRLCPAFS